MVRYKLSDLVFVLVTGAIVWIANHNGVTVLIERGWQSLGMPNPGNAAGTLAIGAAFLATTLVALIREPHPHLATPAGIVAAFISGVLVWHAIGGISFDPASIVLGLVAAGFAWAIFHHFVGEGMDHSK
jgi:hypothetical protein